VNRRYINLHRNDLECPIEREYEQDRSFRNEDDQADGQATLEREVVCHTRRNWVPHLADEVAGAGTLNRRSKSRQNLRVVSTNSPTYIKNRLQVPSRNDSDNEIAC
jgi:hypothetical protein